MYLDLYTHFMNQFTLVHKHYIYTFRSEGNGFLLFSSHYNFIFRTIKLFRTERLVLKVKLSRSCISVVGVYKPPSIPKHPWTRELSSIFSKRSLHLQRLFSTLETSTPIC